MPSLTDHIKQKAVELGFDFVGIAPARPAPHRDAFHTWLENGYHADMQWLARNPDRRTDPTEVVPAARSVVSVGLSYFTEDPPEALWNDPSRGRIARYAWGADYHDELEPRLKALTEFIRGEAGSETAARYYVDTGPVLEHEVAWQAGLGFIGKNTLLIHPDYGSYIFLGEIIVDLELELDEPALDEGARLPFTAPQRKTREASCGNCTRCLTQCPTHAFPAPWVLDSRLCISYLTIELKGAIPETLRPKMKNWIYGCDECQEVCPWVRRYAQPGRTRFLKADPDRIAPSLLDLIQLDAAGFKQRFRNTPVLRTKRRGLLRNVAIALGNWASPEALPALQQAARDEEPLVREHAEWAMARIQATR